MSLYSVPQTLGKTCRHHLLVNPLNHRRKTKAAFIHHRRCEGGREKQTEITVKSNKMVKWKMVGVDAYYVNIKLGSLEVVALVDMGAVLTTLSAKVFECCADFKKILQPCILSHVMGMGD